MKKKLTDVAHFSAANLQKNLMMKRNSEDAMILLTKVDSEPRAVIQGEFKNVLGLLGMMLNELETEQKKDAFQILKEELFAIEQLKEMHAIDAEIIEAYEF